MKSELSEAARAERAELMQAVKALFIPLSLFLSCVSFSAGVFLLYNNESAGWIFIALTGLMAITAFICLVKFQNPYRARGVISHKAEEGEDQAV